MAVMELSYKGGSEPSPASLLIELPGSISRIGCRITDSLRPVPAVHQAVLAGCFPTFNRKDWEYFRYWDSRIPILHPGITVPGFPHGFNSDPEEAEEVRWYWKGILDDYGDKLRHLAGRQGNPVAVILRDQTFGGHLAIGDYMGKVLKGHFPKSKHLDLVLLPTSDPYLFRNMRLKRYGDFPNQEGVPALVVNNQDSSLVDRAIVAMTTMFILSEMKSSDQRTFSQALGHMLKDHRAVVMHYASGKTPIFQVPWFRRILGRKPEINKVDVVDKTARVLAEVVSHESRLVDYEEPKDVVPRFILMNSAPGGKASRDEFHKTVLEMAKEILYQRGRSFPEGATLIWSSLLEGLPHDFGGISAVQLLPVPGKTARDFVDALLAKEEAKREARDNHQVPQLPAATMKGD